MHDYHGGLPGYDPDAIVHDGCGECEARSNQGVAGLLYLDTENIGLLWRRMLNTEYRSLPNNDDGRYRNDCEARLGHQLYLVGVLLERHGGRDEGVWQQDRFGRVQS